MVTLSLVAPEQGADALPHNPEAERTVLGAALLDNAAFSSAAEILTRDDFHREAHRRIFDAMVALAERSQPIDLVTLKEELARGAALEAAGGAPYLGSLLDGLPRISNVLAWSRIIKEKAAQRRLVHVGERIRHLALEGERLSDAIRVEASVLLAPAASQKRSIESLVEFMSRLSTEPPLREFIPGLLQEEGTHLWYADPRALKTLSYEDCSLALATGGRAFHLERMQIAEPVNVGIVAEEDPQRMTYARYASLLAGRGLSSVPENLFLSVQRGVNLDLDEWRHWLLAVCRERELRTLFLDPMRALTSCADGTPKDLKPFGDFVRELQRSTPCKSVTLVHHAVKQQRDDPRKGANRASGGGIWSMCDAPIAFEKMGALPRFVVTPTSWKSGADPAPFVVNLEADDPRHPRVLRLVGEEATGTSTRSIVLHERILEHLRANPGASGNAVSRNVEGSKAAILKALSDLSDRDKVDSVEGKRCTQWFVRGEA